MYVAIVAVTNGTQMRTIAQIETNKAACCAPIPCKRRKPPASTAPIPLGHGVIESRRRIEKIKYVFGMSESGRIEA